MKKQEPYEPKKICFKCGKKVSQVRSWYEDEEWEINGKKVQPICTPCFFKYDKK